MKLNYLYEQDKSTLKAWWIACRPKVMIISFITIAVGTALSLSDTNKINWAISLFALLFAVSIQISTHLINDALDFDRGVDHDSRLGFPKVTQLGWLTSKSLLKGGLILLALGALFAIPLILEGGWLFFPLLLICLMSAYLYTGGPLPISYSGWGDFFAFFFFGIIGVTGLYFLQTARMNLAPILAGAQIGFFAAAITAINNLRDIETDALSGKKTFAVRFGKNWARFEITILLLLPYILGIFWISFGKIGSFFFPFIAFPMSLRIIREIYQHEPSREYNLFLLQAVLNDFLFSLFLVVGFFLG